VDTNQLYSAAEMERMMKLHEVLLKTMAGKMRWWKAAEIIGVPGRRLLMVPKLPVPGIAIPVAELTALLVSDVLEATGALSEAGYDAARSPRRHSELLPYQSAPGRCRSREREHQVTSASRPWLQEPAISAAQGPADGRAQNRICGLQKAA